MRLVNWVCERQGCQPERGAPIASCSHGLVPDTRLNDVVAKQVLDFQSQKFLGRLATSEERDDVITALQDCAEADGADGVETGDVESNGMKAVGLKLSPAPCVLRSCRALRCFFTSCEGHP